MRWTLTAEKVLVPFASTVPHRSEWKAWVDTGMKTGLEGPEEILLMLKGLSGRPDPEV